MSPREESILDQRLKGVTWSVVFTIAGGAIAIGIAGFKMYMGLLSAIDVNDRKYDILQTEVRQNKEAINRHEAQINYLMTNQIKIR